MELSALAVAVVMSAAVAAPAGDEVRDDRQPTRAEYIAERLREYPVFISDHLTRAVPRSWAPEIAKVARRTGVRTFVIINPDHGRFNEKAFLGAIRSRVGADGLYVLMNESGGYAGAQAYGRDIRADLAMAAANHEMSYQEHDLLQKLDRFAEIVTDGGIRQRYERARALSRERLGEEPAFWKATLGSGLALYVLLMAGYLFRRHRRARRVR